ncbi:MAG: PRC-barrel domain containing protein, partial [Candidatus Omnitrophica bacterium]|nr:PRC-barrel domain containing protein [Candidatus Omnitrophota bacterium]
MLRKTESIRGYKIRARDGDIGKVVDFYFDDERWIIRYMVAATGGWLDGRKVLISPAAFYEKPDWRDKEFPVILTKEDIKKSPPVDTEKPVSRQKELELAEYYKWPAYWHFFPEDITMPPLPVSRRLYHQQEEEANHLRSTREIEGYRIEAKDGKIGSLWRILLEDESWEIRYLAADTGNMFSGKKILIAVDWISEINWALERGKVDLGSEYVKNSPEYDPARA